MTLIRKMKYYINSITAGKCLCCGDIATKDVKEIPLGEHILYELITHKYLTVSSKSYETISYRIFHNHFARYPLCNHCYGKVEAKWQEEKQKSEQRKKEHEVKEYYEKLAIEVERKELEERAKTLGIDLNNVQ